MEAWGVQEMEGQVVEKVEQLSEWMHQLLRLAQSSDRVEFW